MKLMLTVLFASSSALASLSTLQGEYIKTSGTPGYCVEQISIRHDATASTITLYERGEDHPSLVFPSINRGRVRWEHDWTDGVTRGTQINTYDGRGQLTHKAYIYRVLLKRTITLKLSGNDLTKTWEADNTTTCNYRKI